MNNHTESGYKGYRSWAEQECPTLKPGETYDTRSTKFSRMAGNHLVEKKIDGLQPVSAEKTSIKNNNNNIPVSKPFHGKTIYQTNFTASKNEIPSFKDLPLSLVKDAFFEFSIKDTSQVNSYHNDTNESSITVSQIKYILYKIYKKKPDDQLVEKYENYFNDNIELTINPNTISWNDFENATISIQKTYQKEMSGNNNTKSIPAWMTEQKSKEDIRNNEDIEMNQYDASTNISSHHVDYGKYGDNPHDRPYMIKNRMASTTNDLANGTTKETFHIPGYKGFIPSNHDNPEAVIQGSGTIQRIKNANLRLYHKDNVPGYTGHKPVEAINYRGESTTGSNLKTTNGATYGNILRKI